MRARHLAVPIVALTAGLVVSADAAETIKATDNEFSPRSRAVAVGEKVTWTNSGALPHEVTAADGSFASGNIAPGASYSYTPTKTGELAYYCRYHGTATTGMVGTLSVGGSAAPLPKTGGGREVATGVAVLALTMVVGGALQVATREGSAR